CLPVFGASSGDTDFDLNLGFQYDALENVSVVGVSVMPDISVGKFGIGLNGTLRFDLSDGFRFMSEDWVPEFDSGAGFVANAKTAASLYLPVFRYIRWGWKGDPLYIRLGELDSVTVGTGIFINGYTNTAMLPTTRLRGAEFDLDGDLFGFPYVGFESFTSDMAQLDIIAGRLYARPMAFLNIPVIKDIQFGGTFAVDRQPDSYLVEESDFVTDDMVTMYGADIMMPLLDMSVFSMTMFGDFAFQGTPNTEAVKALRAGTRGRMLGFFDYIIDATFPLDAGFVPNYFSKTYDLNRETQYNKILNGTGLEAEQIFLHAGTGFSFMDENLIFDISITGVLEKDSTIADPSMTAHFKLGEDLLPFFYFDAYYTKNVPDGQSMEFFLENVLNPTKDAQVVADVTVTYKVVKTTVGVVLDFDENGDMTQSIKVAGNLDLGSMLPFLGN
ncbi:MAG: hypothetical protein PF495_03990, partial [Spirochaetales bacterium]|nr:hypothetical protein [Spirochaetales bacterium]